MQQSKKISPAVILASVLLTGSNAVLADHGSLGFGIGTAGPIVTQPGITLPANLRAVGMITQFTNFNSASDSQLLDLRNGGNEDVHSNNTLLQISLFAAYGVTDDLMLGVRIPYVRRSGIRTPDEEDDIVFRNGNPGGFGDVSIFGQYRFYHSADNLNHASMTIGLKTPTGQKNMKNDQGDTFETDHQPGDGAWKPSAGLSFTRVMGSFSFDTNVLYTVSTKGAQATDLGNLFDYNFALSYAFGAPARNAFFAASNNAPLTAVLELNGEWQGSQRVAGLKDPNAGGNTVFISPGVRYSGHKYWNTALSIGVPVVKNYNGYQTPPDLRITWRLVAAF